MGGLLSSLLCNMRKMQILKALWHNVFGKHLDAWVPASGPSMGGLQSSSLIVGVDLDTPYFSDVLGINCDRDCNLFCFSWPYVAYCISNFTLKDNIIFVLKLNRRNDGIETCV